MSAFSSASFRQVDSSPPPSSTSGLQAVRAQAAFLRSLLDEVERLGPRSLAAEGLADQVVEELSRLGCRTLEAAAELTRLLEKTRGTSETPGAVAPQDSSTRLRAGS